MAFRGADLKKVGVILPREAIKAMRDAFLALQMREVGDAPTLTVFGKSANELTRALDRTQWPSACVEAVQGSYCLESEGEDK